MQAIGEARIALEQPLPPATPVETGRRSLLWIAATAAMAVLAAIATWGWFTSAPPAPRGVTHFSFIPPGEPNPYYSIALSPDGSRLVYSAGRGGEAQLYMRTMADPEPKPIPGTEGGTHAAFSPDGEWLAFTSNAGLRKIRLSGGAALPLSDRATNPALS